ncbi:sulfatase [Halalkalicoccus salilacus]|uniref:sulfatase n=1 Tax=Halalkalicoccus salilacus TaxID=3117459 RepID=UPI00300F3596
MNRPNIVWLTLESTRHDHTSFSASGEDTTPQLNKLANQLNSNSFDKCFSHGIWTKTSVPSILTGTYPIQHGAGMDHDSIPEDLPTIAELLNEKGYSTACFSQNGHITGGTGLDRGFDDFVWFDRSSMHEVAGIKGLLKYISQLRWHSAGYTTDTRKHSLSYLINESIKKRVDKSKEPIFLYAHYGDPHFPYIPPLPYLREAVADLSLSVSEAMELSIEMTDNLISHIAHGCDFSDEEWEVILALYNASIKYTDEQISSIIEYLDSILGETIFIITGDHGEMLGEQDLIGHRLVTHDAICHVPLIIQGPTALTEYDGIIQHIDIMRTLFEEINVKTETIQGKDLRKENRDYAIIQRGGPRAEKTISEIQNVNPDFDTNWIHRGTLTTLRTDSYKYEQSKSHTCLYELPDEETNIIDKSSDKSSKFKIKLEEFTDEYTPHGTSKRSGKKVSENVERQLKEMGYFID